MSDWQISLDLLEALAFSIVSPAHTLTASCSEAVVSHCSHARGTQVWFYSGQQRSGEVVISNEQAQYRSFKKTLISPVRSLPTLLIAPCIPPHSGLPMVLRLIQMFPSVCRPKQLCRETLSFQSPTSPPHLDLHHHVWPCLQSVPHAGPSDTKFPSLPS